MEKKRKGLPGEKMRGFFRGIGMSQKQEEEKKRKREEEKGASRGEDEGIFF